ncbi:adhesion G-protein coupled receptor D1-like [Ptychodera flava]|uniref:adhesion G-protein coupled receptor D1-like n=1 Tax=Ptychodera flava TaxID=63121 RepID=UPI00396A140D
MEATDSQQQNTCQVLAVAMNYSLLSSCCWIMNMSIQQLLRLAFIDRRVVARILYMVDGWLLPLVVVASLYGSQLPDSEDILSCWLNTSASVLKISITIELLIVLVTLATISRGCYIYSIYVHKFETDDIEELLEHMFSLVLLYVVFGCARIIGYAATLARSLYGSYFFALAILFEGSVIFLSFLATTMR